MATLVKGPIKLVTDRPDTVRKVSIRAPELRLHGAGIVTDHSDGIPVRDGQVEFEALPGPAVLTLVTAGGAPLRSVDIVVPDEDTATLAECLDQIYVYDPPVVGRAQQFAREAGEHAARAEAGADRVGSAEQVGQWVGEAEVLHDDTVAAAEHAETQAGIATEQAGVAAGHAEQAGEDRVQTAEDRRQTGEDRVQTGEDREAAEGWASQSTDAATLAITAAAALERHVADRDPTDDDTAYKGAIWVAPNQVWIRGEEAWHPISVNEIDKNYVDAQDQALGQRIDEARWEKPLWLDGTVPVASLPSGLHQVRSGSIARTLGLPTATSGSLWIHQIAADMGHMQWMPTNRDEVYTRRLHGSSWTDWRMDSYVSQVSLTPSDVVEDLPTGLYQVTSASTAETIGLPMRSSGSLWVHRINASLGRMEYRPAASTDVWQRRLASSTAGWQPWTIEDSGVGPHDHDDRYYTKSQVDTLVGDASDGEITGVSLTLEDTGHAFIPTAVGVDGLLYGYTTGQTTAVRSSDGVTTAPESGPRIASLTAGVGIAHVDRTSEGFLIIWRVDSTHNEVWFSPEWNGTYEKVLDIGPWLFTSLAKPRLVAGTTWIMLAEYTNAILPSWPLKRYLSTDGGQTWTVVRETAAIDTSVNSHQHTGMITGDGRIYTSEGDGRDNAWLGYSDDRGKTWVQIPIDPAVRDPASALTYSQPTIMVDFGDTIFTSPDAGPYQPGMWSMDPNTHRQEIVWELAAGGPYSDASKQYGRSRYAQAGPTGKEAYFMFPPAGSGNTDTYIAATPDGGKRWGVVATIPLGSGRLNAGVVGPDLHGNIYMRGSSLPTFGSNVIRAKTIDWRGLDY